MRHAHMTLILAVTTSIFAAGSSTSSAQPTTSAPASSSAPSTQPALSGDVLDGLKFRSLGPGLTSGRVCDFAVNPKDRSEYYVAVASGGVWKTTNAGTTYTPVFDDQNSYSIGCITLDPRNPNVVWVGTGENNSQRSVSWGDGVYRSRDGGKSWENLGLRDSEHIGMIAIDPRDSNVVYVAAQGPLWRPGAERGLYKTTDGGKSWRKVLNISENTGVNDVHIFPQSPDTLIATAYQRRRHVWTLIDGGPESAVYKSDDGGASWRKITAGLPGVDLGRIGVTIAPSNPEVVYAIAEAADGKGGVFRSTDRGETWEKRSGYMASSPQYYNELICDPTNAEHVYSMDTFLNETWDGGKTFERVNNTNRHVDDHALWIDPANPSYLLIGCDGGIYESFDRGDTWRHMHNLPVTQFYRVTVDNSSPFYYVYGGTQDNNSVGGPARTTDRVGVANEHWFVTQGGDGFETQVDPEDPNIVYAQAQHGALVRFDRRNGEAVDVKPHEQPGEPGLRWNWDSPLIISPHNRKRLYFGANKLFRSDDQGNSWQALGGDLTRQLDRNQLQVMGKIQPADAVAKSNSTSFYGNIVSLSESPRVEGLLYVGTDDGLMQVSEDGGKNWRKIESFTGVPERAYVSCIRASLHDADTVYASFDSHKMGDFKPYLLKSSDRGRTWSSIVADIPEREVVYSIAEDHIKPELLFVGTEYGVYCTVNGGDKWLRLKAGLPTIAVRDIDIQRREDDLVLGTFGRGFYILDDYSPLRTLTPDKLASNCSILPVKTALRYIERSRLGGGKEGKGWMGASFFAAPNPPFGATFTYYLKDKIKSRKETRKEAEKDAAKSGDAAAYPTLDQLRAEDQEREPQVWLVVRDAAGSVVRRLTGSRDKGTHRVTWDLRYPASTATELGSSDEPEPWDREPEGPLALAGKYSVTLSQEADGVVTELAGPVAFDVIPLEQAGAAAADKSAALAFQQKVARLQRAVSGAMNVANDAQTRLALLRKALMDTPAADLTLLNDIEAARKNLNVILIALRGDPTMGRRNEPQPPSIADRVETITGAQWYVTTPPTRTEQDGYAYASDAFEKQLAALRKLMETELKSIEDRLEKAGAPWTPGRLPTWTKE